MQEGLGEPAANFRMTFVFLRAAGSLLLLWSAFPPLGWAVVGWVALLPIVRLIQDPRQMTRMDYAKVWLAACLYWLATFYFIPIPHPALWFGWIAISIYLACYLPFFVIASRTMLHRYRFPAIAAVPIAWVGLELIRSHLLTGMGLVNLAHTQFQAPILMQVSDLAGAYTLSLAMVAFTTALSQVVAPAAPWSRPAWGKLLTATAILGAVGGYGLWQSQHRKPTDGDPLIVALIQGSIDTVLTGDAAVAERLRREKFDHYRGLTRQALSRWSDIELVIWPENGWPTPDLLPETDDSQMAPEHRQAYELAGQYAWQSLLLAKTPPPFFMVGAVSVDPVRERAFGSVLLIDQQGTVRSRYFKNHLVMFGEYIPLARWIPLLQNVPAIGKGLTAGTEAVAMVVDGKRLAPSICFETTVPHHIRRQLNQLAEGDEDPDILVNVTNDGWFYGTSCLDFHLACNVFRAVEMRKPLLVCANTGFSAVIDSDGRMQDRGPRRDTKLIRAEMVPQQRFSLYRLLGDAITWPMAIMTVAAGLLGMRRRVSRPKQHGLQD